MKKQQSNLNTSINLSKTTTNTSSSKPSITLGGGNIGSGTLNTITSNYITTNTSSSPYSFNIGSGDCYISNYETVTLNAFFQYFTEKEVDELFDKMLSRKLDFDGVNEQSVYIIQKYVQENICSEDFLMKYYNLKIINRYSINLKHSRYIRTGEYPNLALLLEMEEK